MILNKRKLKVRDELAKSGIPLFEMYSSLSVDTGVLTRDHESLFEICYLKRGSQNHYIDGEEYILQSGEVFITFPQDKHSYSNFSQTMGCLYWLQVDSECLSILGLDHDSTKLIINSLFSLKSRKFPIRDDIAAKLIKAYSIADNGNDIDIVEAKSLLIVFLCELIGSSNSENRLLKMISQTASISWADQLLPFFNYNSKKLY